MRNIRQILGFDKTEGCLGVEIEVEGVNLPEPPHTWRKERDGSLRGESAEYVLHEPHTLKGCLFALDYLQDCYKACGTKVLDTGHAGIHVHVNVQELSFEELFNFITVYAILETSLVRWCGESRVGNLFCLRISDAEYLVRFISRVARTRDLTSFHSDDIRYSSINLKAITTYGSLEFRALAGTDDFTKIKSWVKFLYSMREFSRKFNSPIDVVESFLINKVDFIRECLEGFELDIKDEDLSIGIRYANDIANCTEWVSGEVTIDGIKFPKGTKFPDEPQGDV